MTLNEIIYNIKNLLARGVQSDNEKLRDSQIAFIVNYYRAKLIKQDVSKYDVASETIQDLGKVELIQADPHECCEIDLECTLRTKLKVPSTLEIRSNGHGLTFVGTYGGKPFQETTYNRKRWDSFSKYTGKQPKWYFKNNYVYIVNPPGMLDYINIIGIFEDPKEAEQFRTCDCPANEEVCNLGYDFVYPLKAHHVDTILKLMASTELKLSTILQMDEDNNGKDDN